MVRRGRRGCRAYMQVEDIARMIMSRTVSGRFLLMSCLRSSNKLQKFHRLQCSRERESVRSAVVLGGDTWQVERGKNSRWWPFSSWLRDLCLDAFKVPKGFTRTIILLPLSTPLYCSSVFLSSRVGLRTFDTSESNETGSTSVNIARMSGDSNQRYESLQMFSSLFLATGEWTTVSH